MYQSSNMPMCQYKKLIIGILLNWHIIHYILTFFDVA